MTNRERIDALNRDKRLPHAEWVALFATRTEADREYAAAVARGIAQERFGKCIYIRGIVEFSSHCRNDCLYCGLRRSNANAKRYRLGPEEILRCCDEGYACGYRTFVLQSGEDAWFTTEHLAAIVSAIKRRHPDCAVTLSVGEMSRADYRRLFDAGADRYLLREETATEKHYRRLHPPELSWQNRMRCLHDLKEIGYQTGCGSMVGSPYRTPECCAADMEFICDFRPQMIGLGPFIPQKDTPFARMPAGTLEATLFELSLCRIAHPPVLLPATTALGTIDPHGREKGVLAGANVVMPNLSPAAARRRYLLYDRKDAADVGAEAGRAALQRRMEAIGYTVKITRGDYRE